MCLTLVFDSVEILLANQKHDALCIFGLIFLFLLLLLLLLRFFSFNRFRFGFLIVREWWELDLGHWYRPVLQSQLQP